MEKNVLIITSLFPPGGGPGAKRMIQFVRHLLPLGWNPIVLTSKNQFMGYDEKSLKHIPENIRVYRTNSMEQYIRTPSDSSKAEKKAQRSKTKRNLSAKNWIRNIKSIFGVPDTGLLWLPFAVASAIQIHQKTPFEAILATGPPFSTHLIGLSIYLFTRKRLILDFRDSWVANPNLADENKFKLYLHHCLEKNAVLHADYVIANTGGVQKNFISRYPKQEKSKFVYIPNGFDKNEMTFSRNSRLKLDQSKFNIVHTGTLGGIRNPKYFMVAIKELIDEGKIDPSRVNIHFVGMINTFSDGVTFDENKRQLKLSNVIQTTGFVSREEAFAYNSQADLLLAIIGITSEKYLATYGLSGKIYDYILTEKPILALAQKNGATYELLKKNNIGCIAQPDDIFDIKEKLLFLFNQWEKGNLQSNYKATDLSSHEIHNTTRALDALLRG